MFLNPRRKELYKLVFDELNLLFFAMREEIRQPRLSLFWGLGSAVFIVEVSMLS